MHHSLSNQKNHQYAYEEDSDDDDDDAITFSTNAVHCKNKRDDTDSMREKAHAKETLNTERNETHVKQAPKAIGQPEPGYEKMMNFALQFCNELWLGATHSRFLSPPQWELIALFVLHLAAHQTSTTSPKTTPLLTFGGTPLPYGSSGSVLQNANVSVVEYNMICSEWNKLLFSE